MPDQGGQTPSHVPGSPGPQGPGSTSSAASNDNVLAAVAYIVLWVTGLVVLLTSKPYEKYKRWHAIQAIGLGIFVTGLQVAIQILSIVFVAGGGRALYDLLGGLVALLTLVLIIILAVKAFQGEKVRIPVIAEFADSHA